MNTIEGTASCLECGGIHNSLASVGHATCTRAIENIFSDPSFTDNGRIERLV